MPDFAEDPDDWVFQQDQTCRGAHGAHVVRDWVRDNCPDTIFPWPANSPDLNPIENMWYLTNQAVQRRGCTSKDAYWAALKEEWTAIPQEKIQSLINSMKERLKAVIAVAGANTKY